MLSTYFAVILFISVIYLCEISDAQCANQVWLQSLSAKIRTILKKKNYNTK